MLETLISSKTRVKLLLKFFLNSKATSYLRSLEHEFGDSTNSIRIELNRFEKAGMLLSYTEGNRKYFKANTTHPLFQDTHNLLLKYIGFDKIIDTVIEKLGEVQKVFVIGAFAKGLDGQIIDLVFLGKINEEYLKHLIIKVEEHIPRNILYTILDEEDLLKSEWDKRLEEGLLLWESK